MKSLHKKGLLGIVLIVIAIGHGIYISHKGNKISDLITANIEALANQETGESSSCTIYLGSRTGAMIQCGKLSLVGSFTHTYGCDSGGGTSCNPKTEVTYYNCDRKLTGTEVYPGVGSCF